MELNQNLKKELPCRLRDKVTEALLPDEAIGISLPGSFGEALVVTDRRVIVVRERPSSLAAEPGIDVYSYSLGSVSGVEVSVSNTGGMLTILGANVPQEVEKHSVSFPAYDLEDFQAAREAIMEASGDQERQSAQKPAASEAIRNGGTEEPGGRCEQCGARLSERSLFCSTCGANVGSICEVCSSVIPNGAAYCSGCGTAAVPDEGKCQSCGKIMPTGWYTYCPWCGQKRANNCFSCGAPIAKSWVFCANCGRKIGSDEMDSSVLRTTYSRRMVQAGEAEITTASSDKTTVQLAAEYNERGKTFFENDDVEAAIENFLKAVELDPDNPVYHCNLAVAYDDNDQDEEALREYTRTLDLNPNDTTALLYVGYMYSENDDPEEAARMWRRLIDIAPGTAEAEEAKENLRRQGEL